jgi:hypothetical protein
LTPVRFRKGRGTLTAWPIAEHLGAGAITDTSLAIAGRVRRAELPLATVSGRPRARGDALGGLHSKSDLNQCSRHGQVFLSQYQAIETLDQGLLDQHG